MFHQWWNLSASGSGTGESLEILWKKPVLSNWKWKRDLVVHGLYLEVELESVSITMVATVCLHFDSLIHSKSLDGMYTMHYLSYDCAMCFY